MRGLKNAILGTTDLMYRFFHGVQFGNGRTTIRADLQPDGQQFRGNDNGNTSALRVTRPITIPSRTVRKVPVEYGKHLMVNPQQPILCEPIQLFNGNGRIIRTRVPVTYSIR